jgi:hypothetical protein
MFWTLPTAFLRVGIPNGLFAPYSVLPQVYALQSWRWLTRMPGSALTARNAGEQFGAEAGSGAEAQIELGTQADSRLA